VGIGLVGGHGIHRQRAWWSRHTAAVPYLVAAVADLAVTVWRWTVIAGARHAGHADPSYYFGTARNLAQGRGLTSDYVWEFLTLPPHLHHYAADYWQPLPSILLSIPMVLTGSHSVATALSASVLAAALIPLPTGLLAFHLTGRHDIAAVTAFAVCLLPRLSYWSVQSESVPFFVLFAVSAMAVASARSPGRRQWCAAGALAACAYLCRTDGVFLLLALGVPLCWPVVRASRALLVPRSLLLGSYVLGAGVVLLPWLAVNVLLLHRIMPPTAQLAFLQSYEQLFAVGRHPGFRQATAHGIGSALRYRWQVARSLLSFVRISVGDLFWALVLLPLLNLLALRQRRVATVPRAGWPVLAGAAVVDFLAQAVAMPVVALGGTWMRSLLAYVPLLVIAALLGLSRVRLGVLIGGAALAVASVALIAETSLPTSVVTRNNTAGDTVTAYAPYLAKDEPRADVVVMTRDPWQVNEVTGFPSVMIPDGPLCTVESIAKRYRATDFVTARQRPELGDSFLAAHGFTLLGGSGPHDVYRFPTHVAGCRT
jgi:hypothetical protein